MKQIPRKTKILATLGPASDSAEMIEQLMDAGADGFRLNFSHGNQDDFRSLIEIVRATQAKLQKPIAILQDLQGPKIRIGRLKDAKPISLKRGQQFVITTLPIEGTSEKVSTTYSGLPHDVKAGDKILLDDGAIELTVRQVSQTDVETEVVTGGKLSEHKGMNLPGVAVSANALTEKDIADARFGAAMDVDYVALSFVRSGADLLRLKELLAELQKSEIRVIAKIEKPEAIENLKEILDVSDGVMVARGDLGVEMPAEKVPILQKMIIERANKAEKLVITATQMLESMVNNPRPTRAEASDVANAIIDGTDVVMLSQETAIGSFPDQTVRTMATIAQYTESDGNVFQHVERIRPQQLTNFTHAIVHSARTAAEVMKADAILVFTQSGFTAQLASCQRPPSPIYAFTPIEKTYRQLALVWGVVPFFIEPLDSTESMVKRAEEILLANKILEPGNVVVIVSGTHPARGATNMMKIERIEN